jgi:uncharacterized membrane protein
MILVSPFAVWGLPLLLGITQFNPIILIVISALTMVLCKAAMYRNEWVFNQCKKLINSNKDLFDRLVSYDEMLSRFWIWDINKFIRKEVKNE